jgi:uncharacterized membrane protein (UPF0127 family)
MKIIPTGFSLIYLLIFSVSPLAAELSFDILSINLKQHHYQLQIADNNERRLQGLMYRESLADNEGMLFVYPKTGNYRFWMKNTLIPLTVIWMDEQTEIVDIKLLQPCKEVNCPIYAAPRSSRYVIELSESQFHLYKKGDHFPELKGILSSLSAFM